MPKELRPLEALNCPIRGTKSLGMDLGSMPRDVPWAAGHIWDGMLVTLSELRETLLHPSVTSPTTALPAQVLGGAGSSWLSVGCHAQLIPREICGRKGN